jgi:type 1 glutamine amidotransferase
MGHTLLLFGILLLAVISYGGFKLHRVLRGSRNYDAVPPVLPPGLKDPAILVFSKTNGYRHVEAIRGAIEAISSIVEDGGFSVLFTENGAAFNPEYLSRFRATIWNNTSGDVLDAAQKDAFRSYVENGGGFVGIHGAGGDFKYAWRWYVETLIGAQFIGHTLFPQTPTATVRIENRDDPATRHLPEELIRSDEWYSFEKSPRTNGATVLATLDETTYSPRMAVKNIQMGSDHPVVWKHQVGRGRAFYSALGHKAASYRDPNYVALLKGAIAWAAGLEGSDR